MKLNFNNYYLYNDLYLLKMYFKYLIVLKLLIIGLF